MSSKYLHSVKACRLIRCPCLGLREVFYTRCKIPAHNTPLQTWSHHPPTSRWLSFLICVEHSSPGSQGRATMASPTPTSPSFLRSPMLSMTVRLHPDSKCSEGYIHLLVAVDCPCDHQANCLLHRPMWHCKTSLLMSTIQWRWVSHCPNWGASEKRKFGYLLIRRYSCHLQVLKTSTFIYLMVC